MAITHIMAPSELGMEYQKARIDAASANIANANVVQPSDGSGFKPLDVIFDNSFISNEEATSSEVKTVEIQSDDRRIFQPNHPAADAEGFVRYANIDLASQMVTLNEATRAYEANIKAFNAQMNMSLKALEIGK